MRILIFHNKYQTRGGEDVVVERESSLLLEKGHAVKVVHESNDDIVGFWEKAKTAWNVGYSLEYREKAAAIIREFQPDVVHVHNFFPRITPSVFDACAQEKTPSLLTFHNYRISCANGLFLRNGKPCELCLNHTPYLAGVFKCYQNSRAGSLIVAQMQRRHQREGTWRHKVNRFIALTEFAKTKFLEAGVPEAKISVKSNFGPDLSSYRLPAENYYVYFGRISQEKGIRTLLNAWDPSFPKLLLIGDIAEGMTLNLGQPNIVHMEKMRQQEAWTILGRSKGLIFPTECYEGGFPSVLIEALSIGLPIVASRIGGIPEFLRDHESALLFTPGDAMSLRSTIATLEKNPELQARLAASARENYLRFFTPQVGYKQLLSVYQEALKDYKDPLIHLGEA